MSEEKAFMQADYAKDLEALLVKQNKARAAVGVEPMGPKEFLVNLLRDARHFADIKNLNLAEIDKQAHLEYQGDLA